MGLKKWHIYQIIMLLKEHFKARLLSMVENSETNTQFLCSIQWSCKYDNNYEQDELLQILDRFHKHIITN